MDKKWVIGVIGSVFGFLVAQSLAFYTFTKNVDISKKIEMIHLGQELAHEFFNDDEKTFKNIRIAIEQCNKLYSGFDNKGLFNNDMINKYLGFFDDIGFYYKNGAIDIDTVDQFFGAYIIEAYEYNELKRYIKDIQKKSNQKTAFIGFENLAQELEKIPERKDFPDSSRLECP